MYLDTFKTTVSGENKKPYLVEKKSRIPSKKDPKIQAIEILLFHVQAVCKSCNKNIKNTPKKTLKRKLPKIDTNLYLAFCGFICHKEKIKSKMNRNLFQKSIENSIDCFFAHF